MMSADFYLDPAFGTPNPPVGAPPATYGLAMKKEDLVKGLNLQVMQPITN